MGVRPIEKTLFQFIWTHSKRDQLVLLVFTCTLFPFLFLTLELPKRIINDAIGAQNSSVDFFGYGLSQVGFLWLLCAAFLVSVLCHGLLKMRINTMKGILSERMLRRLRYGLIARMLRFPKPYFQRTSQGELVAMITGETEPMGGMMGDALTQPVLQAGQMLTILTFLFMQSVWFGLAAIALIPLQAWLIPRLQRQINLMNKQRIKEVRKLAAIIGESATGAAELRMHGGWRYRLSLITTRLGVVYLIRFEIYQKKFFMKFINNFITQLTPFFFFSVGGFLVIQGAVSLGALVAALAAYKDLSSPWKELLTYYNQAQDMSLRWETVMDKFSPPGVIKEELMKGRPDTIPHLTGAIEFDNISVTDADGATVLDGISMLLPARALVGIAAPSEEDRRALSNIFTREVTPVDGRITIAGKGLMDIHQAVIAARIGHANSTPVLFEGSFGDNVMMALRSHPQQTSLPETDILQSEAHASGNSQDPFEVAWLDPQMAGLSSEKELRAWWFTLVDAMGQDGPLFYRAMDQIVQQNVDQTLANGITSVRARVWEAVKRADLTRHVFRFERDQYNPALPVTSNLFFATMKIPLSQQELTEKTELFDLLKRLDLEDSLLALSRDVIDVLNQIFGTDGTEHPLFRKLGLDPVLFERSVQVVQSERTGKRGPLNDTDKALLMSLPAQISAEQIGPAFSESMKARILAERSKISLMLQEDLTELYVPLNENHIAPGLSVFENALFGKVSDGAGARADELRRIVSQVLKAEGLTSQVTALIYDLQLGLNGANLPSVFAEPLALTRAAVKRPDILVLEQILASYDPAIRMDTYRNLRQLLPDTTLICIADQFDDPAVFDIFLDVNQGRLITQGQAVDTQDETAASSDLMRKVRALEATDMFSGLTRKQLRLLAFGAKWFQAAADEVIFSKNDATSDGAYMVLAGTAGLYSPQADGTDELITTVGPGKLVGELGLIRKEPRALTMRAHSEFEALRLSEEAFLSVVENDAATAFKMLQVVAGYAS